MSELNAYDQFIANAMQRGWIEPVFDDNEIMMKIVPSDDNPIWQEHIKEVDKDILALVDKGILEAAGLDENGEITYRVTELGERILNNEEDI